MLNFALDEMEHKMLLLFNRQFSTISLNCRGKAHFRFEYIFGLLMLFALYLRLIKLKCLVCAFSLFRSVLGENKVFGIKVTKNVYNQKECL
jgi:hypothetical protein